MPEISPPRPDPGGSAAWLCARNQPPGTADRPAPVGPWPVWKLAVLLYVFAAGAVAINLFMLGLMFRSFGLPALSPVMALIVAGPLGVPAAWAAGRWVHGLLREAEEPPAQD